MSPVFRPCALLTLAVFAVAATASGQSLAAGAEAEIVSRYVWRGVPYSSGAVVQPSAWASLHRLTFGLWSNLVAADEIDRGRFNQLFLTATWRADIKHFSFEPGVQMYHTKAVGDVGAITSTEGAIRISRDVGSFRIFSDHTVDIHTYRGAYIGDAGLIHRAAIHSRAELATQFLLSWASARYNSAFVGVPKAAVNYLSVGGRVTVRLDDHWSLRPHAEWQPLPDRAIRRALHANEFVTAGVALSVAY